MMFFVAESTWIDFPEQDQFQKSSTNNTSYTYDLLLRVNSTPPIDFTLEGSFPSSSLPNHFYNLTLDFTAGNYHKCECMD